MQNKFTKKVISFLTMLGIIATYGNALAATPDAPVMTLTTVGTNAQARWSSVSNATGYMLFYAPYPGATPISSIDMGAELGISVDLPLGTAFYVAIQSYNSEGQSGYSNIEHFEISNQISQLAVQTVTPANQEPDVPYYSQITIAFNNAIDPKTVNSQSFVVTGYLGTPTSGSLATNGSTVVFTPYNDLDTDTTFIVRLNNDIADINGQTLGTNFEYSFTTMSTPVTAMGEACTFTNCRGLAFNGSCLVSLGISTDIYFNSSNILSLTNECPDVPSSFASGIGPRALVYDGSRYWATTAFDGILDVNTGDTIEIDGGRIHAENLAFDGSSFWTNAEVNDNSVLVELESGSFDVLSSVILPNIFVSSRQNISIAFDGVNFWMSNLTNIYKVKKTGEVICNYTPGGFIDGGQSLTYAQGYLYGSTTSGYLFKYDTNLMEKVCEENRP